MTAGILGGRFQLRSRQPGCQVKKNGIVAETARAAPLAQDAALPTTLGYQWLRVVGIADADNDATEACSTQRLGNRGESREQLVDVSRVAGAIARVARRINARRAAQRIDLETRIIGKRCTV